MSFMEDQEGYSRDELLQSLWRRGDLSLLLDSLQREIREKIYASDAKEICILASRQIGKSYLAVVLALEHCIRYPGSIVRVMSPTLKQTSDIVNDNLSRIIQSAPHDLIVRHKSEYRWSIGESTLRLGSLDRSNVDSNRGGNCSLLVTEESGFTSSIEFEYAVNSVLAPMLLRSSGRAIHISSPSADPAHYLHEAIAEKCARSNALYKFTIHDSPSITPEQIREAAERCGGFTSDAFKREYLAEIVRTTDLMVIPEYDDERHTADFEIPEYYKACIVWDMGGIKDKTAVLTCIWDWQSARLLVWDEALFDQNTPTRDIVIKSKEMEKELWGEGETPIRWADVPGQQTVDLASLFKYPVAIPPKDDRDAQINALRLAFIHGKVLIHKRCVNLRGNLKVARYNDKRTDFERHPLFGHCDPLMALVYANRVIDKKTIPLPERVINFENKIYLPHRTKSDPHLMDVSKALAPYNPLKRFGKRV